MKIIEAVAEIYNTEQETIHKKTRKRESSEPRMVCIAIYRATDELKGGVLSREFHLTSPSLFNAAKKVSFLIMYDSVFRSKVHDILIKLYETKEQRERIINRMIINR